MNTPSGLCRRVAPLLACRPPLCSVLTPSPSPALHSRLYLSTCTLAPCTPAPECQQRGLAQLIAGAGGCAGRGLHTSAARCFLDVRDKDHAVKEKALVVHQGEYFDAQHERNKATFKAAVDLYIKRNNVYRRGFVEFAYAALERMAQFGVHRDLATYKALLALFPRTKMIPRNVWQVEFMHYPKQQQCAIDILDFMEENGVIPDDAMGYQLIEIFGPEAHAFRKYRRMMYWMPKFRYANPYYVPYDLPNDDLELAQLAVRRMAVDLENKVTVFQTRELEQHIDDTYIVSGQSPSQRQLIAELPRAGSSWPRGGAVEVAGVSAGEREGERPVFVEGGYRVWLRMRSLQYFVLRAECSERYKVFHAPPASSAEQDMFRWRLFQEEEEESRLTRPPGAHEQDDGTVLAICITGSASKDSLLSWVKFLERENPALAGIPVVFRLRSPETEIEAWAEPKRAQSEVSAS